MVRLLIERKKERQALRMFRNGASAYAVAKSLKIAQETARAIQAAGVMRDGPREGEVEREPDSPFKSLPTPRTCPACGRKVRLWPCVRCNHALATPDDSTSPTASQPPWYADAVHSEIVAVTSDGAAAGSTALVTRGPLLAAGESPTWPAITPAEKRLNAQLCAESHALQSIAEAVVDLADMNTIRNGAFHRLAQEARGILARIENPHAIPVDRQWRNENARQRAANRR